MGSLSSGAIYSWRRDAVGFFTRAPWSISDRHSSRAPLPTQAATPEVCKWACDKDFSCTHFFYNATDFGCYLRTLAPSATSGTSQYASGPGQQRACMKTPYHSDYSYGNPPASYG